MKKNLIISFFILFNLLSFNNVFADNIDDAADLYNEAIDLFKQEETQKSIECFEKAIKLNPEFYEAHYNLAQILMLLDKNEEALKPLKAILELKPNDSETLYNIGKIQYKRGYLSNAHSYLQKIPANAPQYESAKLLINKIEKRQKELNLENLIKERKNLYDETGAQQGINIEEIMAPSGVGYDSKGNIFVASFMDNSIYKISTQGQKTIFSNSNLIKGPIGLALDNNDNIYIANYSANNIIKISQNGQATVFAQIKKPYCITYDSIHNRLYVTEQNTNKLVKFDL